MARRFLQAPTVGSLSTNLDSGSPRCILPKNSRKRSGYKDWMKEHLHSLGIVVVPNTSSRQLPKRKREEDVLAELPKCKKAAANARATHEYIFEDDILGTFSDDSDDHDAMLREIVALLEDDWELLADPNMDFCRRWGSVGRR